jgi:hypothetical protein
VGAPTAVWKVVLLGIIAALLIALGAGMALLPDPSNSVAPYQQATPCTGASVPSDNCYAVVPVSVVSASADHFHKYRQDEEHVIVQAPSGPSEIVLPWEREQDQVLLAGATGTVDVYRGVPVLLAVGGYQFATIQNPVVQKAQTRWVGWIFLSLGLVFGSAVVLTLLARRRAFAPVPSWGALRQAIVQLPPDADPQVVEKMNELQQRLATMQAQPRRGQLTRGQTIGIVIGCAVAVLGALLLKGQH